MEDEFYEKTMKDFVHQPDILNHIIVTACSSSRFLNASAIGNHDPKILMASSSLAPIAAASFFFEAGKARQKKDTAESGKQLLINK